MAMDDRTGNIIPFNKIRESIQQGYVSSRWKTSAEYIKRKLTDGKVIGHTITIGSRKSKMYMRIYDKAMEQGINQNTKENTKQSIVHGVDTDDSWIRIEMEIRQERAEKLQDILLFEDDIGRVYAKIINNYIRFLEPSNDSNRGRWPTAPW